VKRKLAYFKRLGVEASQDTLKCSQGFISHCVVSLAGQDFIEEETSVELNNTWTLSATPSLVGW
jgi:hypothetical protein